MHSQTRLFVNNLPENTDEKAIRNAFSEFGSVIKVDIKSKDNAAHENIFAFVTLSASLINVETCIKHFSTKDFNGCRLYVTRARESFLERLKREREQTQNNVKQQVENSEPVLPQKNPIIRLSENLNPRKRKIDPKVVVNSNKYESDNTDPNLMKSAPLTVVDQKKQDSDRKRMESMKKKRQEFKEKQMIIKTGLIGIDKVPNKKVKFDDSDEEPMSESDILKNGVNKNTKELKQNKSLFDEEDNSSDDDVNFEIKEQFEGEKGQKVLELQTKYRSDKRFTLDKRFIDNEHAEDLSKSEEIDDEQVEIGQENEKNKQLSILEDVLGISVKRTSKETKNVKDTKKLKPILGMLRFDPSQPEHAKLLAPIPQVNLKHESTKSKKKNKDNVVVEEPPKEVKINVPSVEVSKEQFYTVSDTLKEAIAQPNTFSLRSLFGTNEEPEQEQEQNANYIQLEKKKEKKVNNPLDKSEKNPFKYDSSDSEEEEESAKVEKETVVQETIETKAVWKENLFTKFDIRFKEALEFFTKPRDTVEFKKDRRELKNVMKRRFKKNERNNQMFKKKIGGGRKKTVKKSYNKKS